MIVAYGTKASKQLRLENDNITVHQSTSHLLVATKPQFKILIANSSMVTVKLSVARP
jgi:hypothetical protein